MVIVIRSIIIITDCFFSSLIVLINYLLFGMVYSTQSVSNSQYYKSLLIVSFYSLFVLMNYLLSWFINIACKYNSNNINIANYY